MGEAWIVAEMYHNARNLKTKSSFWIKTNNLAKEISAIQIYYIVHYRDCYIDYYRDYGDIYSLKEDKKFPLILYTFFEHCCID